MYWVLKNAWKNQDLIIFFKRKKMNESGFLNYRSWQGEGEKNEINPSAGDKDDSLFVAFMHFTLYNKDYKHQLPLTWD